VSFPPAFVFGVLNDKWMQAVNIKIQSAYQSFKCDQFNAELPFLNIESYLQTGQLAIVYKKKKIHIIFFLDFRKKKK